MRASNLIVSLYLAAASAVAAVCIPAVAKIPETLMAYINPHGGVYLFPTNTFHCKGMHDAFAEAIDENGDSVVEHGCWGVDGDDIVIITDDKDGIVIPKSAFKPIQFS